MNKLFFGIVTVALLAMLVNVRADTFPTQAGPGNIPPEIYLIESSYEICTANSPTGGSMPYIPVNGIQDAQTDGCINFNNVRYAEYAFTGEQIKFNVVVRDLNGAPDIGYAYFTVDGQHEALCKDVTATTPGLIAGNWSDQIPAKPFAPAGFNFATDKVFQCILTVEPQWYGSSMVSIEANDQEKAVTDNGITQTWFFNPAIIIDLSTNDGAPKVEFENGYPGQTVMSTNKLMITNLAEGGVDLWAFIAADDLTDPSHSGAMCPVSNVLDVDKNMQYRCKIGTFEDDTWHNITNKDTSQPCNCNGCLGAQPVLPNSLTIIKNQADAECQFKLLYPVPCIGDFTEGAFHVIVRAL